MNNIIFVFFVSIIILAGIVSAGLTDEDILVSKNVYGNYGTSIDGDNIVWLSKYDLYVEHQVYASAKDRIIVHNITSGDEAQIPIDGIKAGNPEISGRYIVWSDSFSGSSTGCDIYIHDLESGLTEIVAGEYGDQLAPVIAGDIIIWQESFGQGKKMSRISIYNISAKSLSAIEFGSPRGTVTDTDGKNILFSVRNETSYSIYLYNLLKKEKILIYSDQGSIWDLSISGDRAGWIESLFHGGDSASYKLFLYNITSGSTEIITEGIIPMRSLDIDDNLAVYLYGYNDGFYNKNGTSIYFYDLKTRATGLLSKRDGNQINPSVSDWRIVWEDNYPENSGIYLRYYDTGPDETDFSVNQSSSLPATSGENVETPGFGLIAILMGFILITLIHGYRRK